MSGGERYETPAELPLDRPSVLACEVICQDMTRAFLAALGLRQPLTFGIFWEREDGPDAILEVDLPDEAVRRAWPLLGGDVRDDDFHVLRWPGQLMLFTRAREVARLRAVLAASGSVRRIEERRARREWLDGRAYSTLAAMTRFTEAAEAPRHATVLVLPIAEDDRATVARMHATFDRALARCCELLTLAGGEPPSQDQRRELCETLIELEVEGLLEGPLPPGWVLTHVREIRRPHRDRSSLYLSVFDVPVGDHFKSTLLQAELARSTPATVTAEVRP